MLLSAPSPLLRSWLAGLAFLLLGATILTGCGCGGGCAGGEETNIPAWYLNPPRDMDYVYGAGHDSSQKMRVALDTAITKARTELDANLSSTLNPHTRDFVDTLDGRLARQFAKAQGEAMRELAEDASAKEKEVYKSDDGTWRAFVLMEVPLAKLGEALLAKLEMSEKLHTRFRESSAYQELTAGTKERNMKTQER